MNLMQTVSWGETKERLSNWHSHYALIPRCTSEGFMWLEHIERKGSYSNYCQHWTWTYRSVL